MVIVVVIRTLRGIWVGAKALWYNYGYNENDNTISFIMSIMKVIYYNGNDKYNENNNIIEILPIISIIKMILSIITLSLLLSLLVVV